MKALRPQIAASWQTTVRPLCPRRVRTATLAETIKQQQCGSKSALYSTLISSRRRSPAKSPFCKASSCPKAQVCQRPSHPSFPTPTKGRVSYATAANMTTEPIIHDIFEPKTFTWQYVVADPATLNAIIIDPVLDYDPVTQAITTQSADALIALAKEKGYIIERILETHAHADHLTAAAYLQSRLAEVQGHKPSIGIGKRIGQVQRLFGQKYGVPKVEYERVVDKLFDDDEVFDLGELKASVMHLPGHTPDHLGYRIGDNVFCGDSLFHADIGTARCDFPGGSANNLFTSGRRLLGLPGHVKIWTGHDYPSGDRKAPSSWMSVEDHRKQNKHLRDGVTEEEFVAMRMERDSTLAAPKLLDQSLQINIRAGRLPAPAENGARMLHLPLKTKGVEW